MPSKPRRTRSAAVAKKPAVKASSRTSRQVRPAPRKSSAPAAKAVRGNGRAAKPANGKKAAPPSARAGARRASAPSGSAVVSRGAGAAVVPAGPSAHDLAMDVFEKGVRALQSRAFKEAARILGSVIDRYPDEKELHDRARVYITICDRQCNAGREQAPRTLEERMNAATVALNRGAFAEAMEFLRSVKREDAENDAVYYMLAVAHAGLGDPDSAVTHLHEAIELNPDNRFLAAQDSDLEALRAHEAFLALLDSPPAPRRRTATRTRPAR